MVRVRGGCTLRHALGDAFGLVFVVVHHQHECLQGRHVTNESAERAKRADAIVPEFEQSPPPAIFVDVIDNDHLIL